MALYQKHYVVVVYIVCMMLNTNTRHVLYFHEHPTYPENLLPQNRFPINDLAWFLGCFLRRIVVAITVFNVHSLLHSLLRFHIFCHWKQTSNLRIFLEQVHFSDPKPNAWRLITLPKTNSKRHWKWAKYPKSGNEKLHRIPWSSMFQEIPVSFFRDIPTIKPSIFRC